MSPPKNYGAELKYFENIETEYIIFYCLFELRNWYYGLEGLRCDVQHNACVFALLTHFYFPEKWSFIQLFSFE
jgi:hypothetical protein